MEFDIIKRYFHWQSQDSSIIQNVGDDCAVILPHASQCISTDTFNEGVHFFKDTPAKDIAYKALMVNLSDIAAMGARAQYFTLNLTLPSIDDIWLDEFSKSLYEVATMHNLSLIGGDTTKGERSITITIIGSSDTYIYRSGAKVGDGIFVSGTLGGASLALEHINTHKSLNEALVHKLTRPVARVSLGQSLVGIATSCIDISDGLAADLGHILTASGVGATLWGASLPAYNTHTSLEHILYGGDDYELCFTAPIEKIHHITDSADITQIGSITKDTALLLDDQKLPKKGFEHF